MPAPRTQASTRDLDELADIAVICAACDGLPLVVELAAARTGVLTVAGSRDRIANPLPVLHASARDAPLRHQTLRVKIASSVETLDLVDRGSLLRIVGLPWRVSTVAAAAAVTGTDVDRATE